MAGLETLINDVKNKKETVKKDCTQLIFKSKECKNAKDELKKAEKTLTTAKENHFKDKQKEENIPEGELKRPNLRAGPLQRRHNKLKF